VPLPDGALLATPQRPEAAEAAAQLAQISGRLPEDPVTVHIKAGQVTAITSEHGLADELVAITPLDRYGKITEVGISFNRACHPFVYEWNAASNEGRPGVHIAIGGDPDPEQKEYARAAKLVHLDLMAATTHVSINGHGFMRTT
jgi:leucyl aminopeptidase (aminopeptidase T)